MITLADAQTGPAGVLKHLHDVQVAGGSIAADDAELVLGRVFQLVGRHPDTGDGAWRPRLSPRLSRLEPPNGRSQAHPLVLNGESVTAAGSGRAILRDAYSEGAGNVVSEKE